LSKTSKVIKQKIGRWRRCGSGDSFVRSVPRGINPEIGSIPTPYSLARYWRNPLKPSRVEPPRPEATKIRRWRVNESAVNRELAERRGESQLPRSVTEYRKLHTTGHYLNRLFRKLLSEEPREPLLKEAKADAERRYDEFCQGRVRKYQRRVQRLNPISIRASKLRKPTDPLTERELDRQFKQLQGPVNDEIWSAIRRVEKTKACRGMYGELSEQRQLRRISEINIARVDRAVKAMTPRDELIVPRGWPMQNLRGAYVPLLGPPGARKAPRPSPEKQENTGTRADWARLKSDMGAPLEPKDKQAAEKEDKASKEIEALVRRQRRPLRLRTFADLRGQIQANDDILKIGTGK
jgi:hypothetical protein